MATTSSRRTRTVRVHGTELSTDGELFGPYAETMAVLIALIGVLAAAWVVATPSEGADLPVADLNAAGAAPEAPEVYTVRRTSDSSTDVLWADAFDAPRATAVTVVPLASAPAEAPVEVTNSATLG